ncbi:MAG: 5-formyltetrahydrofolate cyclo-ligase [Fibrobacterota bacterium]|nr:5-formyltetrahydrofolate cyclo-ligase [Fibrobacterota bacterium]
MIFDSLGIGELGVVFALVVVLVKPKEMGKLMRQFGKFKRKVTQIQSDVKSQLESITLEAEASDKRDKVQNDKAGMRVWAKAQLKTLPAGARAEAANILLKQVTEWPTYRNAKVVSCYSGTLEEIDTEPLLRQILLDGKSLVMPFVIKGVGQGDESVETLGMAQVADLDKDVSEGAFGILEPEPGLRNEAAPEPDLVLVPGLCFDLRGGRLGKGMGFYDRYLAGTRAMKAGVGFDVQITQKNLTLDPHDQLMDAVISEKRILVFSAPRLEG